MSGGWLVLEAAVLGVIIGAIVALVLAVRKGSRDLDRIQWRIDTAREATNVHVLNEFERARRAERGQR